MCAKYGLNNIPDCVCGRKKTAYIYRMIVLVHMLVFAFQDISSSVGLDGAIIAVQAAEAILDAVCLSPP